MITNIPGSWNLILDCKPDFERAMQRILSGGSRNGSPEVNSTGGGVL